nr:hypothetical protein [Deltaproteobacteria bacterium]
MTEVAPLKVVTHKERCDYETIGYGPKTRAEAVTDLKSRTLVCTKAGFDTRGFIQGTARDGNVCFGFGGGPLVAPGETEISGILSWGEAWCSETSQRGTTSRPSRTRRTPRSWTRPSRPLADPRRAERRYTGEA